MATVREYLSFGDALFLHLERPGVPINIASVAIFDGILRYDEFLAYVEAKLSQLPRCMQRVVAAPFNIGLPSLEYDPAFEFARHVHQVTLKHGTDAELKALAGQLFSANMDRNRPLWDFTLVHGLKENRTGLIARIHHSMADGMSGVAFLNALMDTSSEVPHLPRHKVVVPPVTPQDPATTLLEALTSSWFLTVERLLTAQSEMLNAARRIVGHSKPSNDAVPAAQNGKISVEDFSRIFPEIATAPERMPFNKVCNGPQAFEWADIPFADLRAIKHAAGCSFNDVALAVVAAAYRRYAESRNFDVQGRSLRIVVPVNTRPADDNSRGMGNQITFVPVAVPLDVRDPKKLLTAVHERMTMIKQARIAEMVSYAGALIAAIPSPMQVVLGPIAAQLPLTLCNLIFTNVPGPQQPLYVLGHKMLKAYPYVPIGGEMGSNCALLTYDGGAHFGFSCDIHAAPDPHLLPIFLHESAAELQMAFTKKTARREKKSQGKKRTSAPPGKKPVALKRKPSVAESAAVLAAAGD